MKGDDFMATINILRWKEFQKRQPIVADFIRSVARKEREYMKNPSVNSSPTMKEYNKFCKILKEKGMSVSPVHYSTYIANLEVLAG